MDNEKLGLGSRCHHHLSNSQSHHCEISSGLCSHKQINFLVLNKIRFGTPVANCCKKFDNKF